MSTEQDTHKIILAAMAGRHVENPESLAYNIVGALRAAGIIPYPTYRASSWQTVTQNNWGNHQ